MESPKDTQKLNAEDIITPKDTFIEEETQCTLCGTGLLFQYEIEPYNLVVEEVAHCPSCKIQLKNRSHRLH